MDLQEVRNKAREKMKGCHVCPQCNGKACIGMIPGFGGLRTGRSFMRNVEALQEYGLVMRSMSGVDDPDTTVTILGKTLSMPVLLAPVGGIVLNAKVDGDPAEVEQEYDEAVTQAALEAGTLCFTGDSGAPYMYASGIASCQKRPGIVIPTIKPRSNDQIIEKAHQAEAAGAFAVASDIDAATLINMRIFGQPVGPKSASDIAEVVQAIKLPFIVKGVMSAEEAVDVPKPVLRASSSATTAAASSTAWPGLPMSCPTSPLLSKGGSRSSSTAASVTVKTSSRCWPSAPTPSSSAGQLPSRLSVEERKGSNSSWIRSNASSWMP